MSKNWKRKSSDAANESERKKGYYKRNQSRKPGNRTEAPVRRDENDVTWYFQDRSLLDRAGKIAFTNPLGVTMRRASVAEELRDDDTVNQMSRDASEVLNYRVPGIVRLNMMPSLGVTTSADSPLNVMARNLFSTLQSTLNMKLAPSIEAPDLVCYLGAVDSIDSFFAWVARLYGTIASENLLNKYQGKVLTRANGVNWDDLRVHASDIYFWLLRYRDRVNRTLLLPKGFGFAQRHFWLFGNYFKDSPVEKSQIYVHNPVGFYQWSPTKYETGTALEFKPLYAIAGATVDNLTWAEISAYGETLLQAMLQDQDANSIGGFILRGWGTEGCTTLPEVPVNYAVDPVYSEEILGQIHNAQCVGVRYDSTIVSGSLLSLDLDYRQQQEGDSWLYCKPTWSVAGVWSDAAAKSGEVKAGDPKVTWADASHPVGVENAFGLALEPVMDSFVDTPTEDEVIINSRNMMTGRLEVAYDENDHSVAPIKSAVIHSCGLDIIWNYQMITLKNNGDIFASEWATFMSNAVSNTNTGILSNGGAVVLSGLTKFDWAPRIIFGAMTFADTAVQWSSYMFYDAWDYNNATSVSVDALNKMHLAALDGAFGLGVKVNGYDKITNK